MAVLIGLIETIVDRMADFIEHIQGEVDKLSRSIFERKGGTATRQRRFDVLLKEIGRQGELTSRARESSYSLGRLLTYLTQATNERKEDKLLKARVRTAARDVRVVALPPGDGDVGAAGLGGRLVVVAAPRETAVTLAGAAVQHFLTIAFTN